MNFAATQEVVDDIERWEVSLATNHSVLLLIWITVLIWEFLNVKCEMGSVVIIFQDQLPWRRFDVSECFWLFCIMYLF